jgi:hypothetical protein
MTEEMKFTEDDIIRMNITLGITGDMFRSHGVFYTDFMQTAQMKKVGKSPHHSDDEDEDDPEDNEDDQNDERVDPTKELVNSLKPNYLKTAI